MLSCYHVSLLNRLFVTVQLIYDQEAHLEEFVRDMVMNPPPTEVASTRNPPDITVVRSSKRTDVEAFKSTVLNQVYLNPKLQAAYNSESHVNTGTPSGLGRGSDREVLSVASQSSHDEVG